MRLLIKKFLPEKIAGRGPSHCGADAACSRCCHDIHDIRVKDMRKDIDQPVDIMVDCAEYRL